MNLRLSHLVRVLAGMGLALGVLAVPIARVAACDCAMTPVAEAVRSADVAFVGTLSGAGGDGAIPAAEGKGFARPVAIGGEIVWTWEVELARDADTPATVSVAAWQDDGANCGVSFGMNQRWLIVANVEEGTLRTNGCQPNRVVDGLDAEVDAVVGSMVEVSGVAQGGGDGALAMIGQIAPVVGGVALLGLVAGWAFRREQGT